MKQKNCIYHFRQYETIRSFNTSVYTHKAKTEFTNKSRPRKNKDKKEIPMKVHMLFMKIEN